MYVLLIIVSPATSRKQETAQQLFVKWMNHPFVRLLPMWRYFGFFLWMLWWSMPRQERAPGAGVVGKVSQRKKIALRLRGWKGFVEEGRDNGLSAGQEGFWGTWESQEWLRGNAVTDMTDKWQGLDPLSCGKPEPFWNGKTKKTKSCWYLSRESPDTRLGMEIQDETSTVLTQMKRMKSGDMK